MTESPQWKGRAILRIKMPKSCKDCPLSSAVYHFGAMYFCTAIGGSVHTEEEQNRPNYCPLEKEEE